MTHSRRSNPANPLRRRSCASEATCLRMDLVFTPDGYRDVISSRGRDVDLRDVDGVHLNVAGAVIAAKLVVPALGEP